MLVDGHCPHAAAWSCILKNITSPALVSPPHAIAWSQRVSHTQPWIPVPPVPQEHANRRELAAWEKDRREEAARELERLEQDAKAQDAAKVRVAAEQGLSWRAISPKQAAVFTMQCCGACTKQEGQGH
jgi:hypothetical protein